MIVPIEWHGERSIRGEPALRGGGETLPSVFAHQVHERLFLDTTAELVAEFGRAVADTNWG